MSARFCVPECNRMWGICSRAVVSNVFFYVRTEFGFNVDQIISNDNQFCPELIIKLCELLDN